MVAEVVNASLQVFTSAGVPLSPPAPLTGVLGLNPSDALHNYIGNPRIEYDASVKRWFISTYYDTPSFDGFRLGISLSADPLGSYTIYQIDADTAHVSGCVGYCYTDLPELGYDANGLYISGDLFSNTTGRFIGAGVYALPKAQLIAGLPLTYQYFVIPGAYRVSPSVPARRGGFATEGGGTEYLMGAGGSDTAESDLKVFAISNTSALGGGPVGGSTQGPLTIRGSIVSAEPYQTAVAMVQPDQVGPYGRSVGAAHAPRLHADDSSFSGGVKYLDGSLFGALTSGAVDVNGLPQDMIAWYAVTAHLGNNGSVAASVANQGYIVPPAGYSLPFPAIALNGQGVGLIGTSITSADPSRPGGYPSAGFVHFSKAGPSGPFIVSGQGAATDDGFSGYIGRHAHVGVWGHYSNATVDPVTGEAFVASEYIPDSTIYPRTTFANWGTFVTGVK